MKKLMVMLGAVATAFGLFADATPFSISFESAESAKGVDTSTMKFDAANAAGWTWAGDPLSLVAYAGDAYGYTTTTRRDSEFQDAKNDNYLKLETGSAELARAMGEENIFVDQLVKFTGFEEDQTEQLANGTKIAVWMSGIESDNTADPVVDGETNLYVTVAQVALDGSATKISLKIANPVLGADWETEKWYRLTIKSVGNIFETTGTRAGFIVYIDGVQVAAEDLEVAKNLVAAKGEMTSLAKGYMDKGQLFPAIDAANAVFTSVAYKGIGSIDDVILDDQGPDFCQFVNVSVTEIPGAVIKVEQDSEEITKGEDGKYAVAPGAFTVTYTADKGYILTPVTKPHDTAELVDNTVDDSAEVEPQEVIVTVKEGDAEAKQFADVAAALAEVEAFTRDNKGVTVIVEFAKAVSELTYAFDAGTIITITDDSADVEQDAQVTSIWSITKGNVSQLMGIGNYKAVYFDYDPEAEEYVESAYTLTFAGALGEGSLITAEKIAAADSSITLDPSSAIVTKTNLAGKFVDVPGYKLVADTDEDTGWTTYFLAAVKAYYADLYIEDAKQELKVWLGEEGEEFIVGEEVEAVKPGVIDATVEPDFAQDKIYYVSKLVLIDDEGNESECAFEYDGTTLTKGNDDIGVTVGTGNILSYTVTTGEANPFGQVWLKEYIPVATFTVTATPAENDEYTTQYKIDDGGLADYTEAVTVDLDKTVTIVYTAATGYTITAGDTVVVDKDSAVKDVPAPACTAIEYKYSFVKAGDEQGDAIADIPYTVKTAETLTAPACAWTLADHEFVGWTNTVKGGAVILAGATLEKVLENTELTAAWKEAKPVIDPVKPGDNITIPDGADPDEFAALVESQKDTLLKAPGNVETTPAYRSYFTASVVGATVQFVLNKDGEDALKANANGEIVKIKPNEIAAASGDSMIAVQDPIPGFYYAVKQGNGIGTMKVVEDGILATGAELKLKFRQYSGAGFYQIVVSEKAITGVGE